MALIRPFEGLYYNTNQVKLNDVISPPYDVLSSAQQQELYERSPYNIIRLILNRDQEGDNETTNRYTRAAAFLSSGRESKTILQDSDSALYEYRQRFPHPLHPDQMVERSSLLAALKLEPYQTGIVLPHEETHPKAKQDRLFLMRAARANPEPIYGLYEDTQAIVEKMLSASRSANVPLLHASSPCSYSPKNEEHLIYRIADASLLASLSDFFSDKRVWIADGHHRYETALNYKQEYGGPSYPLQPRDYILIALTSFEDPGLVVLPTHRLVKNITISRMEELPLLLERYFHLQTVSIEDARNWIKQRKEGSKRFVILLADRAFNLTLRGDELPKDAVQEEHCDAWRRLDVSILQTLVLDRSLGISWQDLAHTPDVAYTREEEEAVQKVTRGEYQLACLLQNPTVTEVRDVASAGDKMPQKSTFFYPKLYSGLLIRTLE